MSTEGREQQISSVLRLHFSRHLNGRKKNILKSSLTFDMSDNNSQLHTPRKFCFSCQEYGNHSGTSYPPCPMAKSCWFYHLDIGQIAHFCLPWPSSPPQHLSQPLPLCNSQTEYGIFLSGTYKVIHLRGRGMAEHSPNLRKFVKIVYLIRWHPPHSCHCPFPTP